MLLPADFTSRIAETFYDKSVKRLVSTEVTEDGWVEQTTVDGDTFYANVRFDSLGVTQAELGLSEQIDVIMTCSLDTAIEAGHLFEYGGVKYMVTNAIPSDSHLTVAGRKWA